MDIKTITCHNVYNHGASLQAYALQTFITEHGYQNEIIDYNPWYLYDRYQFLDVGNPKWKKNFLTKTLYITLKLPAKIRFLKRKKAFDDFTQGYLRLTKQRFFNHEALNDCSCDVLICGSDQIWNPSFENGKDPAFFGEFIQKKYLMSYAASLGTDTIPEELKDTFKKRLSHFHSISVREQTAKKALERMGVSGVSVCIDPVYLLNAEQWESALELKKNDEKYMLVYFFEGNEAIQSTILNAAKQTGLKIYSVNSSKCAFADKSFHQVGPREFAELVYNAEVVITNSFHGLSFSLIFQRNVWVVSRGGLNSRLTDLLASIGLENRQLGGNEAQKTDFTAPIDYEPVSVQLNNHIKHAKKYLLNCLEEAKNGIE